ncbi:Flp pilus assembly protein CpaB [Pseudoduganella aquatica]|uniref:Flp pilus assembly protein CpaB n=1 Tax=Pseudoduganella aquatica TaxID=2660641 RepID=A0A7X4HBW5_9BURK|nr:Flp pilus assembly protein CpaB [Pseudoduganella aquatica]MYN08018.1 Flp pilus assembly protein CpaB [Pseudoduganella aquatica]
MKLPNVESLRRIRPGKTWIVLGIALLIGGLAAFAARSFLSGQMAAIEARGKGQMTAVVVAKVDIAKGEKVSNENLAIRQVPSEYAHSVAITPDDFARIDGQAVAYPVKAGEMILWGLMETQRAPSFSSRVESGHRAMTVPVDEINSISGMLEPGDLIDLIITVEQNGKKSTFPLLQRMQVMATGQRSIDDPKSGERRSYSTVTLDTTPAQAQNLIVAREVGKLTALLRNPQDQTPIGAQTNDLASLLGMNQLRAQGKGGRRAVPVLYGNGAGSMTPEAMRLRPRGAAAAAAAQAAQESDVPPAVPVAVVGGGVH